MSIEQKPAVKALFRWAGSKKKLLPILEQYWKSSFTRYVEPFAGSACLFFHLQPKKALLGDLNSELIHTYKTVKKSPQELAKRLALITPGEQSYYKYRSQVPALLDPVESATRFIFLNRSRFNGLFRTNIAGQFNVPYGGDRTGSLPSVQHLVSASKILHRCTLKCADFEKVLASTSQGDFVYLDPPFAVENRRVFKQYGPQNFGIEDMTRLALWLDILDKRGVAFVLSYAYCSEALKMFGRWNRRKVFVRRNIAGFVKARRFAAELIVTNI